MPSRTSVLAVLTAAAALSSSLVATLPAQAATSSGCAGGGFTATSNGRPFSKADSARLPADTLVNIRGRYVEFDFAPVTGNVYNYVYTGAANPESMTSGVRTPLFASKTLDLGAVLTKDVEARIDGNDLTILARGGSAKVKIQAKDCATGGVFQQEVEADASSKPVVFTHTLAPGMSYFLNPYTNKVNFGNGGVLRGKDSPQVATRLSQTAGVAVWSVASGGRMGGVLGEDAVELSAGATTCVSDCQAQNQVRGSLPVTDPAFSG
jgi:putative cofactor-binding repeat protein